MLKIAMVQLFTENIKEFAELSVKTSKKYCKLRGYDYYVHTKTLDESRPPAWSKIIAIQNLMKDYDWIFWLDSDAIVTNFKIRLESLIAKATHEGIIIAKNGLAVNSGSMLVRGRDRHTADLFKDVWASEKYINHVWWEQKALIEVLKEEKYKDSCKIIDQNLLNSNPENHNSGDFIIHACGKYKNLRLKLLNKWSNCAFGIIQDRNLFGLMLNAFGIFGNGVEVGVQKGKNAACICNTWDHNNLYLVDPWKYFNNYKDVANVPQEIQDHNFDFVKHFFSKKPEVKICRETSTEFAKNNKNLSFKFVYLDGDHSYEAVKKDLTGFFPLMEKNSVLAGHDYLDGKIKEGDFGVKSAVDDFFSKFNLKVNSTGGKWPSWYVFL